MLERICKLTDNELFRVVESSLPTADRYATYPGDFTQKGYPRKDRPHLDPPALVTGPGGRAHYAVMCGFYQLHGAEGAEAGLEGEVGEGYGTSVKILSTIGDRRIAMPRVETKEKVREQTDKEQTEPPRRQLLDEADLTENSNGGEETEAEALRAGLAGAIRYGKEIDRLLNDAMELARDVTAVRTQNANIPGGSARRFNELKARWRAVYASTDLELLKSIRE
ncbi:hypothetical protein MMC29_001236 [Sticta canariensis]|nr:hypothetical protein [Sticta canariensis]